MKLTSKKDRLLKKELKKWEIYYSSSRGNHYDFYIRKTKGDEDAWDRNTIQFQICSNPTGNCQLMSIGNFEELTRIYDEEEQIVADTIVKIVFQRIYTHITSKRVILLDTREVVYDEVRQVIKTLGTFVPSNSFAYNSANTTKMRTTVFKLNTNKIKEIADEYTKCLDTLGTGDEDSFSDIYEDDD
jgi:hypothetical protein